MASDGRGTTAFLGCGLESSLEPCCEGSLLSFLLSSFFLPSLPGSPSCVVLPLVLEESHAISFRVTVGLSLGPTPLLDQKDGGRDVFEKKISRICFLRESPPCWVRSRKHETAMGVAKLKLPIYIRRLRSCWRNDLPRQKENKNKKKETEVAR